MVIIIGGSWGIGHWTNNELTGPGIAQYFGFVDVTLNLCRSGDSNLDQLQRFAELIGKLGVDSQDKIYWLVHNPIVNEAPERLCRGNTIRESVLEVLHKHLDYANTVAMENNFYIELIGASCDLNDIDVKQYSHLYVKVPSWGQLLDSSYPASIFSHQSDHMHELKRYIEQHRTDLKDEYDKMGGLAFGKRRTMLNFEKLFSSFHPTSLAHEILMKHLTS